RNYLQRLQHSLTRGRAQRTRQKRNRPGPTRLTVESLEERVMPSADILVFGPGVDSRVNPSFSSRNLIHQINALTGRETIIGSFDIPISPTQVDSFPPTDCAVATNGDIFALGRGIDTRFQITSSDIPQVRRLSLAGAQNTITTFDSSFTPLH